MFRLEWLGVTESRLRELDRWKKQQTFSSVNSSRVTRRCNGSSPGMRPTLDGLFADLG